MKPGSSYKPTHSIAILVVGEPKTGKSCLSLAFPDPGIIDCGQNLASAVRRAAPDKKFWVSTPALNDAETAERPLDMRWEFVVSEAKKMLAETEIKTLVVDDIGIMCEWLLWHCVRVNKLAGVNKTGRPELNDYGSLGQLLRSFVTMCRSVGKIVVFTSHQAADKNELTGAMRYSLAIPGQSKENLGGLFTDVWATTALPDGAGGAKYEIRTRPTGFHVALGTSFDLPNAINVTGKSPAEIWTLLQPKLYANTGPTEVKPD